MHDVTVKWIFFLLLVMAGKAAMAEGITSPDGNLRLDFVVNSSGEPVYRLSYKNKAVVNPSKLGLELQDDLGLMDGFTLVEAKTQHLMKPGNPCGAKWHKYGIITTSWL